MAGAFLRLLDDPALAGSLISHARRRLEEQFIIDAVALRLGETHAAIREARLPSTIH